MGFLIGTLVRCPLVGLTNYQCPPFLAVLIHHLICFKPKIYTHYRLFLKKLKIKYKKHILMHHSHPLYLSHSHSHILLSLTMTQVKGPSYRNKEYTLVLKKTTATKTLAKKSTIKKQSRKKQSTSRKENCWWHFRCRLWMTIGSPMNWGVESKQQTTKHQKEKQKLIEYDV